MFDRKTIEQKILNSYTESRLKAHQEVELKLLKARQNADFNKTYIKIKDLEYLIAEKQYKNEETETLTQDLNKLRAKLRTITRKLGYNVNDFKEKFNCPTCQDTGYVGEHKCNCFKQKINDELIKASGLEISALNTFNDFKLDLTEDQNHKEQLLKIKNLLKTFADKFPLSQYKSILLSGKTGVGKTFLLECTTSEIMKKGYTANFLTAFQMNNQFLKYHTCFDANKQSYLNLLLEPDLLVIDDLGTEPLLNNVTIEYLYLVISERMLKSKSTLISTNLDAQNILSRYGERIFSRLFDKSKSILIKIDGTDLRQIKRSN